MPKKKWGKPKLIILCRHEPAEMVLVVCKGPGHTAPVGEDGGVLCSWGGLYTQCNICSANSAS